MQLWEPTSYKKATHGEKKEACNGCGPQSWKRDFVPDTIYGVDISEACNIHDWMYLKGQSIDDKKKADRVFLNNMIRIVKAESRFRFMSVLRQRRCWKYYLAVAQFGGPAFWEGKK